MSVPENLRLTYNEKTLRAMKAERAVKRITFDRSEASPTKTLYVRLPKLNKDEVLVPGSQYRFSLTSTFLEGTPTTSLSRTSRGLSLTGLS